MADREKSSAESHGNLDLGTVPIEEPEQGIFSAYSNVVNVDWTLYDLRLRFAELMQVPDDETPIWNSQHPILLERASITMPWHQAKHLRNVLDGIIRNYEALNGELKPIELPDAPRT